MPSLPKDNSFKKSFTKPINTEKQNCSRMEKNVLEEAGEYQLLFLHKFYMRGPGRGSTFPQIQKDTRVAWTISSTTLPKLRTFICQVRMYIRMHGIQKKTFVNEWLVLQLFQSLLVIFGSFAKPRNIGGNPIWLRLLVGVM